MASTDDGDYIAYVTGRLPALRRVAAQLAGDAHRGDDLVQETITRLYTHWRRASAAEHLDAYVYKILVRAFLDDADSWGDGVVLPPVTTRDGYRAWAESYDRPGNQLIDLEQPVVREILAELPAGIALDVACGTGRHARYLAEQGHRVIGVDSAPAMLDRRPPTCPKPIWRRPTCAGCRSPITPSMWSCAPWRSPTSRTSPRR